MSSERANYFSNENYHCLWNINAQQDNKANAFTCACKIIYTQTTTHILCLALTTYMQLWATSTEDGQYLPQAIFILLMKLFIYNPLRSTFNNTYLPLFGFTFIVLFCLLPANMKKRKTNCEFGSFYLCSYCACCLASAPLRPGFLSRCYDFEVSPTSSQFGRFGFCGPFILTKVSSYIRSVLMCFRVVVLEIIQT